MNAPGNLLGDLRHPFNVIVLEALGCKALRLTKDQNRLFVATEHGAAARPACEIDFEGGWTDTREIKSGRIGQIGLANSNYAPESTERQNRSVGAGSEARALNGPTTDTAMAWAGN